MMSETIKRSRRIKTTKYTVKTMRSQQWVILFVTLHCYAQHVVVGEMNSNDKNNINSKSCVNNNINNTGERSNNTCSTTAETSSNSYDRRPHIIFILADDLGFNDVGFRGSAQIPTPNIDALAYSGIVLNRYYVNPICTPSRAALMTGKYPIHLGMQHTVLYGAEPRGLPLTEKIMPQYFNELGYSSHIAGKWHLGHYKMQYTPLFRGFKTHVGFWTGHQDYFDHTAVERNTWGLDMRNGTAVAHDLHGKYTTDIITDEAVRVISTHNTSQPLFLYVAHAAAHSSNPYNPLPAPDANVRSMSEITNYARQKYAAIVSKLDESVGRVVEQLERKKMLNDSIIVFSTDNGGPAEGFNLNAASNWPLRGVKNTLWEGGVRGVGVLWSPRLGKMQRISEQTMHIVDWLPTLLGAIDGGHNILRNISHLDGLNLWSALKENSQSPRKSVLHNIDGIWRSAGLTMGDWKVVVGTNYNGAWDGWYGPAGVRDKKLYDTKLINKSAAGRALGLLKRMPLQAELLRLRQTFTVNCITTQSNRLDAVMCQPLVAPCLFNVKDDPCENNNLAGKYPNILETLLSELNKINSTALPPANLPLDPRGDPRHWDYTWTNFGDHLSMPN